MKNRGFFNKQSITESKQQNPTHPFETSDPFIRFIKEPFSLLKLL